MGHNYTQLYVHAIFATKDRVSILSEDDTRALSGYMAGIAANTGCYLVRANGPGDHMHLLVRYPPAMPVSELITKMKANSSRWLNDSRRIGGRFEWQPGYSAFSVSASQVERVESYIGGQVEHHRAQTFADELADFLRVHGLEPHKDVPPLRGSDQC